MGIMWFRSMMGNEWSMCYCPCMSIAQCLLPHYALLMYVKTIYGTGTDAKPQNLLPTTILLILGFRRDVNS